MSHPPSCSKVHEPHNKTPWPSKTNWKQNQLSSNLISKFIINTSIILSDNTHCYRFNKGTGRARAWAAALVPSQKDNANSLDIVQVSEVQMTGSWIDTWLARRLIACFCLRPWTRGPFVQDATNMTNCWLAARTYTPWFGGTDSKEEPRASYHEIPE